MQVYNKTLFSDYERLDIDWWVGNRRQESPAVAGKLAEYLQASLDLYKISVASKRVFRS